MHLIWSQATYILRAIKFRWEIVFVPSLLDQILLLLFKLPLLADYSFYWVNIIEHDLIIDRIKVAILFNDHIHMVD